MSGMGPSVWALQGRGAVSAVAVGGPRLKAGYVRRIDGTAGGLEVGSVGYWRGVGGLIGEVGYLRLGVPFIASVISTYKDRNYLLNSSILDTLLGITVAKMARQRRARPPGGVVAEPARCVLALRSLSIRLVFYKGGPGV